MSEFHLNDLKKELEKSHWVVVSELEGNDYDISGVWLLSRPDGTNQLHLEFEGLDDMETLPLNKSYGCRIKENPDIKLYLSRIEHSWKDALSMFIKHLNSAVK